MGFNKFLDRIGGIFLNPKRTFEIITLEGYRKSETITINVLNAVFIFTFFFRPRSIASILTFLIVAGLWFFFISLSHVIISSIYKMPGSLSEFIHYITYSTVTVILLIPVKIFEGGLGFILLAIWFIWFNIVMYYAFKAYYRIDVKQYIATLFNVVAVIIILFIFAQIIMVAFGIGVII